MKSFKQKVDSAGEPIKIEVAERYVDEYRKVKERLDTKVFSKLSSKEKSDPTLEISEAYKHFSSKANAFIFSKDMVDRFFTQSEENPTPAQYLMVLFAAKFEGDEKSNPTVVLAGVNPSESGNEFVSLNIEDPGTEQPPFRVNYRFPPKDGGKEKELVISLA